MKIEINQGDAPLTIGLADSDGDLTVTYDEVGFRIETTWPDDHGRIGVIYDAAVGDDDLDVLAEVSAVTVNVTEEVYLGGIRFEAGQYEITRVKSPTTEPIF